jgi:hypothetical protein
MSAQSSARGLPAIPWNGVLVAATVVASVVSIIFILDDTKWPDAVWRLRAFQYLLREQDIAGSILAIAIVIGAWVLRKRNPTVDPIGILGRNPWPTAAITFVGLCAAMLTVAHHHALSGDEHLALFQSRIFAAGHLTGQFPSELVYRLIPTNYIDRWLIASESGRVASMYWPGFSLILVPFTLLGVPWACNPLLASLSLVLIARLASQLTSDTRAGGWAMLFALGSPGFVGMALSYFSMTAHLFLNLLFAWLLLERSARRLIAAGIVGSLALVQNNPVPHLLFALPWIAWIGRRPGGRRDLLLLGAGYAPLALILGLGWWLFLRALQGKAPMLLYPPDSDPLHHLGNLIWYLSLEFRAVFSFPVDETLAKRVGEQVRLWSWAVPGLPLLALAGWWAAGRRVAGLHLFALSLASTLVGYLFVSFDQGYGWGARYVHAAWGALPLLAAAAMVWAERNGQDRQLGNYIVRAAVYSLVFATALRLLQIHLFMQDQLALRPPFEKGARQIVFIAPNFDFFTQDFVQNDPFLRAPVIFMMSRGRKRDYQQVIERRFPRARLTYDGPEGQVWRLAL